MWPRSYIGQTRCDEEITALLTNPKTLQFANRISLLIGLVLIASMTSSRIVFRLEEDVVRHMLRSRLFTKVSKAREVNEDRV
jgi:hypothetical protein